MDINFQWICAIGFFIPEKVIVSAVVETELMVKTIALAPGATLVAAKVIFPPTEDTVTESL